MTTKRKWYTVTTNLQAVEVADKTSKGGSYNVGKQLRVNCEYGNEHSVSVLKDDEIVSHLPRIISRVS